MTDLTDRMRTCAAHLASVGIGASTQAIDSAADLLIEASKEIELLTGPIDMGEPMEVIPPVPVRQSGGTWIAPGDTLPIANPFRSRHTCPKCDSRAAKRVRRIDNKLMIECPSCAGTWEYK